MGPGSCAAVSVCLTKALPWGLGSALQSVCPTRALQWGLSSASECEIQCAEAQYEALQKRGVVHVWQLSEGCQGALTRASCDEGIVPYGTTAITPSVYLPDPRLMQLTRGR